MTQIAESISPSVLGTADMKTFKQFIEEAINISGNFNGTLIVGDSKSKETQVPQSEEFSADIVYMGNIHRISMKTESGIPTKNDLTEYLQSEYPGSIVQHIYVKDNSESSIKVTDNKRYHPAKLDWV
jgi:hypothetical protein